MSITLVYLGHACILVEMAGARMLMDPWLVGPSQGNGWWHFPPVPILPEALGSVDYIMISHVHDDHFHLPTLERLPKSATAIVPYGLDAGMAQGLRDCGFAAVLEIENGKTLTLAHGIEVENYQRGRIDSAYWLRHDRDTLLNLNDCPVSESWLRQWKASHPQPDIALAAFSYASPFPLCYDVLGRDPEQLLETSAARVLEQFAITMGALRPRFAIPFATQYAFFLAEQRWMNRSIPAPQAAVEALARRAPEVRAVVLNPGDRLSTPDGSVVRGRLVDWDARGRELDEAIQARAPEIANVVACEDSAPPDLFERFAAYFERMLSRNWLLRRKIGTVIAIVPEPGVERWIIDCRKRRGVVRRAVDRAERAPIEIRLPRTLLAHAVDGSLHWETLYLSNRLHVTVRHEDLGREWQFWRMLFNFREGLLRDRLQWVSRRGRRVLRSRYPELIRLVGDRFRRQSHREPYVGEPDADSVQRPI